MPDHKCLKEIVYLGLVLITSLGLSLLFTPISSVLAKKYGFIDLPDPRKIHSRIMPRLGGLAMAVTLIISFLIHVSISREILGFLFGAVLICFFGILDDKFGLNPKLKYLLQVIASTSFIIISGAYIKSLGNLLGFGELELGSFGLFFTIFGMVGLMNAINLSDGLDGLAAGKCLIASCFLFVFAYFYGHYLYSILGIMVFGILLGFLRYNSYPARLFMGDSGSLLLGYTMAVITVALVQERPYALNIKPISMAMIFAVSIGDTLVVMGRRIIQKRSIFHPDKTHLHHRLLGLGFSHPTSVAVVYIITFFFGTMAWVLRDVQDWIQFYGTLALIVCIYVTLRFFEKRHIFLKMSNSNSINQITQLYSSKVVSFISLGVIFCFFFFVIVFASPSPQIGTFSVGVIVFFILLFPWNTRKEDISVAHSCFYLAILFLNYIITTSNLEIVVNRIYWNFYAVVVWSWVCMLLINRRYRLISYPNTFEGLTILITFFYLTLVFFNACNASSDTRNHIIVSTLLSIPLYLVLKIYLKRKNSLNKKFALIFIAVFFIISLKALRNIF